jgi:hypothetical protein
MNVAVFVAHFVAGEVFGMAVPAGTGRFAACRVGAVVSVIGVEVIIDMAVEVSVAVIPGPGADEYAAAKPFRTVVAVGGAVVAGSWPGSFARARA